MHCIGMLSMPSTCHLQAAYTHVGPYSNLVDHVVDPFGENIISALFGLNNIE